MDWLHWALLVGLLGFMFTSINLASRPSEESQQKLLNDIRELKKTREYDREARKQAGDYHHKILLAVDRSPTIEAAREVIKPELVRRYYIA